MRIVQRDPRYERDGLSLGMVLREATPAFVRGTSLGILSAENALRDVPPIAASSLTRYFIPSAPSAFPPRLGFRSEAQSVHGSRTIMLADLTLLLDAVPAGTTHDDYERAITEDNVLGKRTASTRLWAWKKLRELYALDPEVTTFRILRHLWDADPQGRRVLALLAAMARDALLRASAPVIIEAELGDPVKKEELRDAVVRVRGERFAATTLKSLLANLFSSWAQAGHLTGSREKRRARPSVTPGAIAFALALGYMTGARGLGLFSTPWTAVLDVPPTELHDLAREASRRGWLTYRGIGEVVDITFESLFTPAELRELQGAS